MENENALPPSKKRAAGRELSRDNPGLDDEEEVSEQATGTFKRASEEVIASRRIVKVRRSSSSVPSAPTSNPFAGIRLVPPPSAPVPVETNTEAKTSLEEKTGEEADKQDDPSKENGNGMETENEKEKTDNALVESSKEKETGEGGEKASETTPTDEEKAGEGTGKEADTGPAVETKLIHDVKEPVVDKSVDEKEPPHDGKETEEDKAADDQGITDGDKVENKDKEDENSAETENKDKKEGNSETSSLSSFQQLSSTKNAFTGLAGSGFSNATFSFGSITKDGSPSGSGFLFGSKPDQPSIPSFGLSSSNNGNAPLFSSTTGASTGSKSDFPSKQEVSVETGEENEETVFNADSALYEFTEGGWRERGKGELKINVSNTGSKKARLVMRAKGNYRLILNAYLYADMKLAAMDKKGVSFACMNSASEGNKNGLATFALKFKDVSVVEEFSAAVIAHKARAGEEDNPQAKTAENSPKSADV